MAYSALTPSQVDSKTFRVFGNTRCSAAAVRLFVLWSFLLQMVDFQILVKGFRYRESPRCNFSDFLQPEGPGGGEWTYKYAGFIHVAKVNGGLYTVTSNSPKRSYRANDDMPERQTCYKQYGPDLYAVEFEGLTPSYQCFRFLRRGEAVVQIALSDRKHNPVGICNLTLRFDHAPWISVKLYKTATEACPFTGGINFHEVIEYSRDHQQNPLCYNSYESLKSAPLRLESDCVKNEGFNIHFSHESCIPTGSHFGKSQKLLCMASWEQDGNGFALLRKENERAFYCARINFTANQEVKEMIVYLSWVCYRETDLNSHNKHLSIHTNYVRFRSPSKTVISLPCREQLQSCSPGCPDHSCIRTCRECLNSTGVRTEMDPDVVGSWFIGEPHGHTTMEITPWTVTNAKLGKLRSVTFDPDQRTALRSVLWDYYENGCYPRFVCMYYDTPAPGLMRYRLSNILSWPIPVLHDSSICTSENFIRPPVFGNPDSKYEKRPWDIAVTKRHELPPMPCIYPDSLPEVSAFVDEQNRTGCLTLRSRSSPRTFTIQYVDDYLDPYRDRVTYLPQPEQHKFRCVAAMTYIDTYKTVITQSSGFKLETLCWMIVDDETIVVVNTSSCNMQTAQGVIRRDPRYMVHLKWQLSLRGAGQELNKLCQITFEERERKWRARLAQQIDDPFRGEGRKDASRQGRNKASNLRCRLLFGFDQKNLSILLVTIISVLFRQIAVR
ncbi:hypothetical protein PoB_007295700 [Plakobranchus ocellatus]|uniref:Uncharacterized protein n=1 Tax=Plakobranchus ocellatus TaxID=259542 RepID=A0AAV4DQA9_9GAST|nr:hypothetical protein PoB_007295700 [Plakobranchus ocellatus]